jgi:hypothetical protein
LAATGKSPTLCRYFIRIKRQEHDCFTPPQSGEVPATAIPDPALLRLLVGAQHAEGDVLPAGFLDLPGAGRTDAVGVQEPPQSGKIEVGAIYWTALAPEIVYSEREEQD